MPVSPLLSLAMYSEYVAITLNRPSIQSSTVMVWPDSPYTGIVEGEISLSSGIRLRIREEIDFDTGLISAYGYEVYEIETRIYWYDDFPHPNDPTLASTYPHHKHIQPDIKHHRIPAPDISFDSPNLLFIIEEAENIKF